MSNPAEKRILLIEEDAAVRVSLSRALQSESYTVIPVRESSSAFTLLGTGPFGLVLLDLDRPQSDGWEVYWEIERLFPFLPVIVITARPDHLKAGAEAKASARLEKPLNLPQLLETIESCIHRAPHVRDIHSSAYRTPQRALCPDETH